MGRYLAFRVNNLLPGKESGWFHVLGVIEISDSVWFGLAPVFQFEIWEAGRGVSCYSSQDNDQPQERKRKTWRCDSADIERADADKLFWEELDYQVNMENA